MIKYVYDIMYEMPLKARLHQRKLINLAAHPYQEAWQSRPRCQTCPSWSQTHPCNILQPKSVAAPSSTLQVMCFDITFMQALTWAAQN